jgi:hypothetical protein
MRGFFIPSDLCVVNGANMRPRALAKALGRLEKSCYPRNVCCGWRDFESDILQYGAKFITIILEGKRVQAYFVAFETEASHLYVSDIARAQSLRGEKRQKVMGMLQAAVVPSIGDRSFEAELRKRSRSLATRLCDIISEEEEEDYFDDGESALHIVARLKRT